MIVNFRLFCLKLEKLRFKHRDDTKYQCDTWLRDTKEQTHTSNNELVMLTTLWPWQRGDPWHRSVCVAAVQQLLHLTTQADHCAANYSAVELCHLCGPWWLVTTHSTPPALPQTQCQQQKWKSLDKREKLWLRPVQWQNMQEKNSTRKRH